MKVRIEIDTQTFVRFWLVVIGFAFAILMLYLSRTALVLLAVSVFLALALNKPVASLSKYIPGNSRVGATAIAYVAVVAILGGLILLVIPPIVDQTTSFVAGVPAAFQDIASQRQVIGDFAEKYNLQPQIDQAVEGFKTSVTEWITNLTANIASSLESLFGAIAAVILVLVLSFLMLLEGPQWMKTIWGLYTDKSMMKEHKHLVNKMANVVSGYVNGQLTVSAIGAVFAGLTTFILSLIFDGVEASIAMPIIAVTFVFVLIPMFGSTIAGVLSALLLMLGNVPAGIIFGVYFLVYQQIENNFIAPAIQAKYIQLSPLTVLAAATIGLYMAGLFGGIVAIPIAGCIKVLSEHYLDESRKKRNEASKPLEKITKKLQRGS